uniref:Uncharacterized protein n=1 Tax=Glossina brevipalpis TaxID=37001 RepID=A0A1A9W558_9MUSC
MSTSWLCSEKISKLALYLIVYTLFTTQCACFVNIASTGQTIAESTEHINSLTDDIQHKEFVNSNSQQPHLRRKRLIWITDDGRLALPPGTSLTFTPTIALPLVRHPPEGFFSNLTISFPVTIDFDKLGLTDNQNPLGDLPPIFARSFGHTAGVMLSDYMTKYLHFKRKRDLSEQNSIENSKRYFYNNDQINDKGEETLKFPQLPERFKHIFHGGERIMLYGVVENFLSTFGLNGKACLLRAICEIHSRTLDHFGVFGEMVKLFLTVTKSPFSDLIPEYVKAQEIGEGLIAPAECFPYYKDCPKSIFKAIQNHKYSNTLKTEYDEQETASQYTINTQVPNSENSVNNEIENDSLKLKNHIYSM